MRPAINAHTGQLAVCDGAQGGMGGLDRFGGRNLLATRFPVAKIGGVRLFFACHGDVPK